MKSLLQTWYIFMVVLAGITIYCLNNVMIKDPHNSDSLKLLLVILLLDCIVENMLNLIRFLRS